MEGPNAPPAPAPPAHSAFMPTLHLRPQGCPRVPASPQGPAGSQHWLPETVNQPPPTGLHMPTFCLHGGISVSDHTGKVQIAKWAMPASASIVIAGRIFSVI